MGSPDHLSFKTKEVSDIFLCFWLVKQIRKEIIYNSSMLGGLKPTHTSPTLGLRSQDAMILEANAMCNDMMP